MSADSVFRPMLAAGMIDEDHSKLFDAPKDCYYGSPKIDGWRVTCHPIHGPVTRSGKRIPNTYVHDKLTALCRFGFDGEVTVGDHTAHDVFNRTQSALASFDGEPDFTYHVFDEVNSLSLKCPASLRIPDIASIFQTKSTEIPSFVRNVEQSFIKTYDELIAYVNTQLQHGYEGACFRHVHGSYKQGRSTFNQRYLLKWKPFEDAEAEIIGAEPLYINNNEAYNNEVGYQKRGFSQDGYEADYTRVGALYVRGTTGKFAGVEFSIGSGLDDDTRRALMIMNGIGSLKGKTITYKFQPHGSKDAPRTPIWKGFRND